MVPDRDLGQVADFVKVDFHVHTPASRDYTRTSELDEVEYRTWLEQSIASGCRIVAVTDHNTFAGYTHLQRLIESYRTELQSLEKWRSKIPNLAEDREYVALSTLVQNLNDIWLLPGIEVEPYEGFHLLVLFPTETAPSTLQGFLREYGVQPEEEGYSASVQSKKGTDVLELAARHGAMVIGAHMDGAKGLYEVTYRSPSMRLSLLTHGTLVALQFNNQVNADKLKSMMQDPKYTRESKLAFIQCSDFHNHDNQSIGHPGAYVRLPGDAFDRRDFGAVKASLQNPDESISSPAAPAVNRILNNLIQDKDVLKLENLDSEQSVKELARAIAALVNSAPQSTGKVIAGVSPRGNRVGLKLTKEEVRAKLRAALALIVTSGPFYRVVIYSNYYPVGDRIIAAFSADRDPASLCAVDSVVLVLKDNEVVPATPRKIRRMVESTVVEKYKLIADTQEKKISEAVMSLNRATGAVQRFELVRKLVDGSYKGAQLYEDQSTSEPDQVSAEYEAPTIGVAPAGANLAVAIDHAPRQEEGYWRFLVPMVSEVPVDDHLLVAHEGDILFTPGGACYCVPKQINVAPTWYGKISVSKDQKGASAKSVLAYFKSSLCLWYLMVHYDSCELSPQRLWTIPVPRLKPDSLERVGSLVDQVLKAEIEFLELEEESQRDGVDDHNSMVAALLRQIDEVFYREVGLSAGEMTMVHSLLDEAGIWLPLQTHHNTDDHEDGP